MKLLASLVCIIVVGFAVAAVALDAADSREKARQERGLTLGVNLVKWDDSKPDGGWTRWSPRDQLAPDFAVDRMASSKGVPALRLAGARRKFVFGGWRRAVDRIEGGKAYRFAAEVVAKGVPSPRRNIVCQILWKGPDLGNEFTPEYVNDFRKEEGYKVTLDQTFIAPPGADSAEVALLVQWMPTADLLFRDVVFETGRPESARMVKLATVYWRPSETSTPQKNVEAFSLLIDKVAAQKPDVVLLPESITSIGTGLGVADAAQEQGGPAFLALAAKARQHRCYIIYGAYEKEGDVIYNSAFIIARDGTLAGKYRKVQLPFGEVESGLSPGDFYRTFQLDFARIGILICHDTAFGEPARVLMLDGAEIIFVPIWGGDKTQLRARAMDNGVYLVSSGYDVPSMVIDPTGEEIAVTWKEIGDGTAFAMVDLAAKVRRPWVGDWHNAVIKQRRTDAYQKVVEE